MKDKQKVFVIGSGDEKLMRGITSAIHANHLALGNHKPIEIIELEAKQVSFDLSQFDAIQNEKLLDFQPSKNAIWKERIRKFRNSNK